MAAAAGTSATERARHFKDKGNEAFRRRDYRAAAEHYTAALEALTGADGTPTVGSSGGGSEAAAAADLRLPLLTNRSLVRFRLGDYAAAAVDAEVALSVDPCSTKAAFRAAAARLALGDAAAALCHAELLQRTIATATSADATSSQAASPPAGWQTLRAHASALLAHQQQVEACRQRGAQRLGAGEGPAERQVGRLLRLLAAEAEGEADDDGADDGGPAELLGQLTGLLGSTGDCHAGSEGSVHSSGSSAASATVTAATDAAAAFCAVPGLRGWRLLLFFLADPDPCCQAASQAALKAVCVAAAGSAQAVLWPLEVWQRLVGAATELTDGSSSSSSSGGSGGSGDSGSGASIAALQLLGWAAERDAWVRYQLLPHPLAAPQGPSSVGPAGAGGDGNAATKTRESPLAQIVGCLGDSTQLCHMPPGGVLAAAHLLQLYARDAESAEALEQLACGPLLALVRACGAAEGMAAFQPGGTDTGGQASHEEGGSAGGGAGRGGAALAEQAASGMLDSEKEALAALRLKRQAVYNEGLVALRCALLAAAADLAQGSRELLLAEAVTRQSGGGGKRVAGAGAFLTELLSLVRSLHEQQPRRSTPVLGPDGTPRTYEKRRFAADFKDNPAGDFLLTLDLDNGGGSDASLPRPGPAASGRQHAQTHGQGQGQGQAQHFPPGTLLALALNLLQTAASSSAAVAALLHRQDLLTLCQELCAYCTPSVVAAGQKLYATLADAVPSAAEELLQSGGGSSGGGGPPALAALLLCSASWQRQLAALGKLAAVADTCSGDDFALFTGLGASQASSRPAAEATAAAQASAVYRAWQLTGSHAAQQGAAEGEAGGRPELQAAARRFLLRCCERAQRQQQVGLVAAPRGGAWAAIGRQPLLQLLKQERQQGATAGEAKAQPPQEASFTNLKRGFFSAPAKQAAGEAAALASAAPPKVQEPAGSGTSSPRPGPRSTSSVSTTSTYKSGAVVIEELDTPDEAPVGSSGGAQSASPRGKTGGAPGSAHPAPQAARQAGRQAEVGARAEPSQELQQGDQRALEQGGRRAPGLEDGRGGGGEAGREGAVCDGEEEEEEEVPDLQDVFDSSTCLPAQLRRERAAWVALPLDKKLKWTQTSSDVSVSLAVPAGTAAADVAVSAAGGHLAISLRWFGQVLGGTLHQPVKAGETHWCLEGGELHVLLTKGDASWWKCLLEGDAEKSYYEILQEAVNADEPVQPYDQMDESSRGLLESIQERQSYINAGLIDPEGFDDFRVVIGENSLGGGGRG